MWQKAVIAFALCLLINPASAQMAYEEFKKTYRPTNEYIAPNNAAVEKINAMDAATVAALIETYAMEAVDGDEDSETMVALIMTSVKRSLVAQALKEGRARSMIVALLLLKEEWQQELLWHVDKTTYHNLAPHVTGVRDFKGMTGGMFGKDVGDGFKPVYAGAGYNLAVSAFKPMNNWIENYQISNSAIGTMNPLSGFGVFGAFQINERSLLDVGFDYRTAKSGLEADTNPGHGLRFNTNTLGINYLKKTRSQVLAFGYGPGLALSFGGLSSKPNETASYSNLTGYFNVGLNYNVHMWINPVKKLPLMVGAKAFAQLNFLGTDFSELNTLHASGIGADDLKGPITNFGIQLQVIYKFGGSKVDGDFPSFNEELQAHLDPKVNTAYSELMPRISPDGHTLYFVRSDHPSNTNGSIQSQDIWMADVSNGISTANATHLTAPFNKEKYNNVVGVSPDENAMIINGAYKNGELIGAGYSKVVRTVTGWSEPEMLVIKDYSDMSKGSYSSAYWTQDGKHLILSFSESSTDESQDMYISFLQDDGTWSRPKSLGNTLNTDGGEHSPFLASDGKTLYFASDREGGKGSDDIWMTRRQDDSWTNWSEPENLGSEINTEEWEGYYCIDAAGEYAYMVSGKNSKGREDIVRVKLAEESKPDPVVLVTGRVLNANTEEPLDATIAYNGLEDGKNYGIARTNPATGEYKIVLPYGVNYDFSANAANFIGVSDNLDLSDFGEYEEIERDLYLVPLEVGSTVRLNNIFFETAKSELKEKSFVELNRVVTLMNENPNLKIEISGHTDNVGDAGYNKTLSQDRANAVVEYLVSNGVDASRFESKGYGMDKPVADNTTEEGRALNRRVEFTILEN